MRKSSKLIVLLSVLLLAALACSLPIIGGDGEQAAGTAAPGSEVPPQGGEAGPTPSPEEEMITVYTLEGKKTQVPVLPPATYSEVLARKVEDGTWEYGEGLVILLKYLAGELEGKNPGFDIEAIKGHATDIIWPAQAYLKSSEGSSDYVPEIERLLEKLVPSQQDLDRLSRPESEARSSKMVRVGMKQQADVPTECAEILKMGFGTHLDQGEYCYLFRKMESGGHEYRVYFPKWWLNDPEQMSWTGATLSALKKSVATYSKFGSLHNINVVFSASQPEVEYYQNTNAWKASLDASDTCPVVVLPRGMSSSKDIYKQIIAHEVFHCFQDWNMTTHPYFTHSWWMEGSAEYFSNVVYPDVNDEQEWVDNYYQRSIDNPMIEKGGKTKQIMDYENFLFFQFLGNKFGEDGVITFLEDLSSQGGISAQKDYLINFSDMHKLFQEFVIRTMVGEIKDTNGKNINSPGGRLSFGQDQITDIQGEGNQTVSIEPFVAGRFLVRYQQEQRYLQTHTQDDHVLHAVRSFAEDKKNIQAASSWYLLPDDVRSFCDRDEIFALAMTTFEDEGNLDIGVDKVEQAACDPCLLGTWAMDNEAFAAYLQESMNEAVAESGVEGMSFSVQEVSGALTLTFNEKGRMVLASDGLEVPVKAGGVMDTTVVITAEGAASYSADGEVITGSDYKYEAEGTGGLDFGQFSTGEVSVHLTLPQLVQFGTMFGAEAPDLSETETSYACSQDSLRWMTDQPNPLLFVRSTPEAEDEN